jgi:hypothetical protein
VCAILVGGGKYESTKEESVQSPDRFFSNVNIKLKFTALGNGMTSG